MFTSASRLPMPATGNAAVRPSARSTLPQELQLYFSRLTTSLVPKQSDNTTEAGTTSESERHRLAALESLRQDSAVGGILVYLVKWFAESIQKCLIGPTTMSWGLLQGVESLLRNESIFLEPYLHQLLGPVMSVLLTVPLGSDYTATDKSTYALRTVAANVLRLMVDQYGSKYPGLQPRLLSTLKNALDSSFNPVPTNPNSSNPKAKEDTPIGRYEGAILGIWALGPNSVSSTLLDPRPISDGSDGVLLNAYNYRINDGLCDMTAFSTGNRSRFMVKAWVKAVGSTVPKPKDGDSGVKWADVKDDAVAMFGSHLAGGMEKKHAWLAAELIRRRRAVEGRM